MSNLVILCSSLLAVASFTLPGVFQSLLFMICNFLLVSRSDFSFQKSNFLILIIVSHILAILSSVYLLFLNDSGDPAAIINLVITTITIFSLYFIEKKALDKFIITTLICLLMIFVVSKLNQGSYHDRTAAIGIAVTQYANLVSLCLIYVLLNNRNYVVNIILIFLTLIVIGFLGSKKSLIILLPVIVYYFSFVLKSRVKLLSLIFVIPGVYYVSTIIDVKVFNLVHRLNLFYNFLTGAEKYSNSTSERISLINYGVDKFIEQPWIGYGAGAFKENSGFGKYTHSNLIEILYSFGIFLTCLLLIPFVYQVYKIFCIHSAGIRGVFFILVLLLVFIVLSFTQVFYYVPIYMMIIGGIFKYARP